MSGLFHLKGEIIMGRSCLDCKNALEWDQGYSNWTVEGTDVYCVLGLNPALPVDRFYGAEPALSFAENCEQFETGNHPRLDVELEELEPLDRSNRRLIDFVEELIGRSLDD